MKEKIDISVIIPSYNSEHHLKACLDALAEQKTIRNYEVIVIDSSEHDLVSEICKHYNEVVFSKRSEKTSPGIARNIGAKLSRGKILIFIDSDVILDQDALENIWNTYKEGLKVFGGALELHKDYRFKLASAIEHYYFNHETQKNRKRCIRKNLSSAFLIFDRELFIESGGFKDIPRMQDTELTERVSSMGIILYLEPAIIGYQIQDSGLKQVFKKIYINGRNIYPIRYKNRKLIIKVALILFLPFIFLAKASRISVRNIYYLDVAEKPSAIFLTPLIFVGCFLWMTGFYISLLLNKDIISTR